MKPPTPRTTAKEPRKTNQHTQRTQKREARGTNQSWVRRMDALHYKCTPGRVFAPQLRISRGDTREFRLLGDGGKVGRGDALRGPRERVRHQRLVQVGREG